MPKRLYRSRTERWIAGVCGGLSDYFNVDVIAPRVAFVLLALWNGFGLVLYLLLVILLPDEPLTEVVTEPGLPPVPDEGEPQRRAPGAGFDPRAGWGGLIVLVLRPRRKP